MNGSQISQTRTVSPGAYRVQSDTDEVSGVVVSTVISSTDSSGIVQQQCVIESRGGGDVGETVINAGASVQIQTSISGADAVTGLTGITGV